MKKSVTLIVLLILAGNLSAQILRPFASRYYNSSVKGSIVYVSNSIVTSAGFGPGVPGTGELAPTGISENGSTFMSLDLDVDNPVTVTKSAYGSVWNYYNGASAPADNPLATNWKQSAYTVASPWNTGATPVAGAGKYGFGGTQTTCIPSGGGGTTCVPTGAKRPSYYFRRTVNFTAAELSTTFNTIQLNMYRNDGIVVYINGVERIRNNMPTGTIAYATLASSNIANGGSEIVRYNLSPSFFTSGNNTIAVEVHLSNTSNADMSFDMEVLGIDNNGTFNSTTSNLSLPSCSNVLFAGLYWGTGQGASGSNTAWITGENNCKLKLPGASVYTNITSSQTDYWNNTLIAGFAHTGFQCFANITSLVNATNPNGTYTVADVVSPAGIGNGYGGWTIVIAYANPTLPNQNLSVFDGCVSIKNGSAGVDVPITGFLTPPTGPVSCELGAVVYDGDRNSPDSFSFKQNGALVYYSMANAAAVPFNSNTEVWNSKISYKATNVTTRNPAFNNTLGYDASIFDLPNGSNLQLGNNRTSAVARFSSSSENYIVQLLTTTISQYNPAFAFDKTATDINGGLLIPGDSIRYQINYNNTGNDSSTNTIVIDNIPLGTTFIPGSIRINGVAKTDASGDDQAEYIFSSNRVVVRLGTGANATVGGNVGPGVSGNIQFSVVTASSCDILSCAGSLRNSARVNYNGKLSGTVLYDSSGVNSAGCIVGGPVISPISGSCFSPKDTLLVDRCPIVSVMLPWRRYAGYTFYSSMPFIPANVYNHFNPVTASNVYWAYYNSGSGCSDTARVQVIITGCPDIDDDDDGIPDYVEFGDPLALVVVGGLPNWNRPSYPGYVDYNSDGVNDLFDWGADADNDGIPNFQDRDFWKGWVDVNNDGVNDLSDKDMDGIPNQFDLDSDNDGIPDVVESYGVDTNGDGKIDNFTDTDFDGFSQNVDGSNTGVGGSGNGLGTPDFDGDGIPNYLDLDSDNDGIPDLIESGGTDANNDAKIDGFTDLNGDGLSDYHILASAILITGPDVAPVDGRADSYPNKNKDRDFRPNAYDMDSDGDGIVDVIEAGFPDVNLDGIIDGALGANGWANVMSARPSLGLRFTDSDPYPDYLDIDSDDDGIPDNIEGQTTAGYKMGNVTTDTDGDGLVNLYDNFVGFGGSGIYVYDHDGDNTPDYIDTDSDADGLSDRVEGNDFNLNGIADDNVSLTGLDTDGDGLDNRFDSLNSVTNLKGTSYRMGTSGSFTGDATPGSRTTVQRRYTPPTQVDRDWRYSTFVLPVQFLNFTGTQNNNNVFLQWTVIADKEIKQFEIERSIDNYDFVKVATVKQPVQLQTQQSFSTKDDITGVNSEIIYYRLKVIGKDGTIKYSNILIVRKTVVKAIVTVRPNPATTSASVMFYAEKVAEIEMRMIDKLGQIVFTEKKKTIRGYNTITLANLNRYCNAVYTIELSVDDKIIRQQLIIWN